MTNTHTDNKPHVRLIYKSLEMSVVESETYLSNNRAYLRCLPPLQQGRRLGLGLGRTLARLSLH